MTLESTSQLDIFNGESSSEKRACELPPSWQTLRRQCRRTNKAAFTTTQSQSTARWITFLQNQRARITKRHDFGRHFQWNSAAHKTWTDNNNAPYPRTRKNKQTWNFSKTLKQPTHKRKRKTNFDNDAHRANSTTNKLGKLKWMLEQWTQTHLLEPARTLNNEQLLSFLLYWIVDTKHGPLQRRKGPEGTRQKSN